MEIILDLGNNIKLAKAQIDELIEQDVNARSMSSEMFQQLTKNIENRGTLEALPFCAKTERGIEIVSGHHRVRAARSANITEVYILLDDSGLSRDEIIAKQLAHNSINGIDDRQLVAELFKKIQDVDARIEAYIDPKDLEINLEPINIPELDVGIDFKAVTFAFLPNQVEQFNDVMKAIDPQTGILGVSELKHWDKFKEALNQIREIEDIRAIGMAISRMSEITLDYLKKQNPDNMIKDATDQVKADKAEKKLKKDLNKSTGPSIPKKKKGREA